MLEEAIIIRCEVACSKDGSNFVTAHILNLHCKQIRRGVWKGRVGICLWETRENEKRGKKNSMI
jgi:hypothetical protein